MALVAGALCAGCVAPAQPPPKAVTIAVFEPSWATSPPPLPVGRAPLLAGLQSRGGVRTEDIQEDAACFAESACLARAIANRSAEKALSVRLAALGDTVLVRASLLDTKRGTIDESRQTVVLDATAAKLSDALTDLGRALAAPFAPPPKAAVPLARSAWFWAIIGASVLGTGAAIGAGVMAAQPRPDVVVTPP